MTTRWQRTTSRRALRSSAARSLLGLGAAAAATAAAALAGCAADDDRQDAREATPAVTGDDSAAPPVEVVVAVLPDARELSSSAQRFWSAHAAEDWAVMFPFEDPTVVSAASLEDYTDWQSKNQPIRVHEATVLDAEIDDAPVGRLGWVLVDRSTSARRFQDQPRRLQVWQKWRVVDGSWKRVPDQLVEMFPDPPSLRDLESEPDLRRRFDRSWQARMDRNWPLLYELVAPADQAELSFEDFMSGFEQLLFDTVSVEWVSATPEGRGLVHGVYMVKPFDPSQTKAPFRAVPRSERWVRVNGVWYMDLPGVGDGSGGEEDMGS